MDAAEVLAVIHTLTSAGCRVWVVGGWGVDALIGSQTRSHRDLDLAVDATGEATALQLLNDRGYDIETDWRPVRVELAAPGDRWVDVHPIHFDENGDARQSGPNGSFFFYPRESLVEGRIDGTAIPCLSVAQQIHFHSGYEPRDIDIADLAHLHRLRSR
jgi:lincosamide nucleotidyltransferase A/C/D/E